MNTKKNKLIILDRDGVINFDSDKYIKTPDEWVAIDSSLKAITKLNRAGYKVAVATNQSGIARGLFDPITLSMIHKKMARLLAHAGGHIDALEYCPDHPDAAGKNRKPNPGMLHRLMTLFNVSAETVYFVGDSFSDLQCAINAGCQPVLVLTGKGMQTLERCQDLKLNLNPTPPTTTCPTDTASLTEKLVVFNCLNHFVEDLLNCH